MISLKFGYYPLPIDVSAGPITVTTLPDITEAVDAIESSSKVEGGWIYAPLRETYQSNGSVTEHPYPARVFNLPKTHLVTHLSPDDSKHLDFHLWILSFFTGMRLTSTTAGFLDSTPIKPGILFDFVLSGQDNADVVAFAEAFWVQNRSSPERAQLAAGIVHALFLSQNPRHLQYEKFLLLYTAFDACFALAKSLQNSKISIGHADRISWMCRLFDMPLPEWAARKGELPPEIVSLRNESVHEALLMSEPLGFALHGVGKQNNLLLELEALICRLLVALLGSDKADYVVSPVSSRQRYGLKNFSKEINIYLYRLHGHFLTQFVSGKIRERLTP